MTVCLLVFAIVAVALYWPVGPFDTSHMPDGGYADPAQMVWFLDWTSFALGHWLNVFHTSFIDYPTGVDLANNTSVPFLGLLAAPVTLLVGPVASFNFLLRLALFSSATSMFVVLRTCCRRVGAAFVGGLVYGFGPYLTSQAQSDAHLNLAFGPLPPVIIWCLYELIVVQRRRAVHIGLLLGASPHRP